MSAVNAAFDAAATTDPLFAAAAAQPIAPLRAEIQPLLLSSTFYGGVNHLWRTIIDELAFLADPRTLPPEASTPPAARTAAAVAAPGATRRSRRSAMGTRVVEEMGTRDGPSSPSVRLRRRRRRTDTVPMAPAAVG